jgi:hypothetical protein
MKGQSFVWDIQYEKSFQELKRMLTSAPVLILPDPKKSLVMYCCLRLWRCAYAEGQVVAYAYRHLKTHEKVKLDSIAMDFVNGLPKTVKGIVIQYG